MNNNDSIGLRIKVLRTEKRMKQVDLAKILKVDRSTVSKIENDEIKPTAVNLLKMREIFSVPVDWILTGEGERPLSVSMQNQEKIVTLFNDINRVPGLLSSVLSEYFAFKSKHVELFEAREDKKNGNGNQGGGNGH